MSKQFFVFVCDVVKKAYLVEGEDGDTVDTLRFRLDEGGLSLKDKTPVETTNFQQINVIPEEGP